MFCQNPRFTQEEVQSDSRAGNFLQMTQTAANSKKPGKTMNLLLLHIFFPRLFLWYLYFNSGFKAFRSKPDCPGPITAKKT